MAAPNPAAPDPAAPNPAAPNPAEIPGSSAEVRLDYATQIDMEEMVYQTLPEHHTAISVLDPVIFIEKTSNRTPNDPRAIERYKFRASFMLEVEIKGFDHEYDELDSYDHRV